MTSTHYVVTLQATMPEDTSNSSSAHNGHVNGSADLKKKLPKFRSKYKHVEALHKVSRPSVLSHDQPETPSFLGFRNLMVLTISEWSTTCPECQAKEQQS